MPAATLGFLLVIATGSIWAGVGVLFSNIARKRHDFVGIRVRSAAMAAAAAWIVYPDHGGLAAGTAATSLGRLAAVLIPAAVVGNVGMFCMNRAMGRGHHGASWTLGQTALVIPFLAGVLVWNEALTPLKAGGVFCIVLAVCSFGGARERAPEPSADSEAEPGNWFAPALAAFFLLGCQQTLMTVPSRWEGWEDLYRLRVPLLLTGMALSNLMLRAFQGPHPGRRPWRYVFIGVAISLCSQWLMFQGIDALESVGKAGLAFPVAVGTCVLGFNAYSLLLLRESTTPLHLVGTATGLAGILILSLS